MLTLNLKLPNHLPYLLRSKARFFFPPFIQYGRSEGESLFLDLSLPVTHVLSEEADFCTRIEVWKYCNGC